MHFLELGLEPVPVCPSFGNEVFLQRLSLQDKGTKKAGNNYKNWFAEQRGMNWNIVDNEYPIFFHDVVQCYSNIPTPLFR